MKPWYRRTGWIAGALLALAALQSGLLLVYRSVEQRQGSASEAFAVEALDLAPAPQPTLMNASGERVAWAALRGKLVLVHFWATWCTPCREELPALLELASSRRDSVHLVAVSLDSGWQPVRLFFDGEIPNVVSLATNDDARAAYGVSTLPDTFVVSANGSLLARARGTREWRSPAALETLKAWEASR